MRKIQLDYDNLPWWAQPLLAGVLLSGQDPEELKRYAELAGIDLQKLQELEDKKPQG